MKKLHGLDKYVIFSISVVLIYTVAEFIATCTFGFEQQQLTICVYGFFAGEVTICGLLRIFKLRSNEPPKGDDDGDVDC